MVSSGNAAIFRSKDGEAWAARIREWLLRALDDEHPIAPALTGGNVPDLNKAYDVENYDRPHVTALCPLIRLKGERDVAAVAHLEISHSAGSGIANLITGKDDIVKDITNDSSFADIDIDGIALARDFSYRNSATNPKARLTDLKICRNRMEDDSETCPITLGSTPVPPEFFFVAL